MTAAAPPPHEPTPYPPVPPGYPYPGYAPGPASPYRGSMPRVVPVPAGAARGRELVGVLAFVVASDLLAYAYGTYGLAQALFFPVAAALVVAVANKGRPSARLGAALALLGLVSAHLAWAGDGLGNTLAAGLLFTVAILARAKGATFADVAFSGATSGLAVPSRVGALVAGLKKTLRRKRDAGAGSPGFAFSTVLVPAAALAVFAGVFLFANPVLEAWTARLLAKITFPSPARPLFWLFSAAGGAILFRPAIRRALQSTLGRRSRSAIDDTTLVPDARLAMARNTLVVLNALFLVENAVDAVSLWAGRPPAGLGYTAYAHRGTAWLTFALFLSTLVLGAIFRGAFHFDPRAKLVRRLAYVWAAQNVVLALGTFRRIQIYVDLSGLTSARILGIFGTALVVLGFAFAVRMISSKKSLGWLLHRQLDALVAATVLFVAAPTDYVSTRFNVARVGAGQYAPLLNVVENTRSDENVPAMIPLLSHPDPIVRSGVAAMLSDRAAPNDKLLAGIAAKSALDASAARIEELSPAGTQRAHIEELAKLVGAANEDEQRYDYRGRGGARWNADSL